MLVTSKELVEKAKAGNYAVGAFNAINMESAQSIFAAAEEEKAPFILQITATTLSYTAPDELVAMIKALIKRASVPAALHLDHGRDYQTVLKFLRFGFSSVMIDGSLQADGKSPRTYEENIEVTRKAAEAAHLLGVSVEGEIGRLGQIGLEITAEDEALTRPEEAEKFIKDTGVDLLAVSIGTHHELFKGKPVIRHDRIKEIAETIPTPLVMHGGTGVPDEDVRKAISLGIRKVNIDTEIRVAFIETMKEEIKKLEDEHKKADETEGIRKYDIRKILKPCRESAKKAIAVKMRLFGSSGKA